MEGHEKRPPFGRLRIALLAAIVGPLLVASLWPLDGGWRSGMVRSKLELALLELRYPLFSVSTHAERGILAVRTDPYRPGEDSHLIVTRGKDTGVWIDGREQAALMNIPGSPLLWSLDQRLWLGGASGLPGPPMSVRRLAIYDRALHDDELARLFAAGRRGPGPEPLLLLEFDGEIAQGGSAGPAKLELPPGAAFGARGLSLAGGVARSEETLREVMRRIREEHEFSVELVWQPNALPSIGALPLVAFEGEEARNFRIDASQEGLSIRVRAGYISRKRVADFALNIAAYVPLGLVLVWGRRSRWAIPVAAAAGFLMSLGIETLQTLHEGRVPSLIDLFTNTLGAALGAVVWSLYASWRDR